MTLLRVRGVKRVTAKGHVYYYHRATGARLQHEPSTSPAAFAAEVRALDLGAPAEQVEPLPGSVGALVARYRGAPEFQNLKPATRKSYLRVFDATRKLDELDLDQVDQPFLLGLRDMLFRRSGRWLANYTMSVFSVVFAWGTPRGFVAINPAAGVPKIRRARGSGVPNKAWKPAEVEAALKEAGRRDHIGLRKAIALAYYAGLRKADVIALPAMQRKGGALELAQSKTDGELTIFESRRLTAILDEPDKAKGATLVRRNDGAPYTADGLDSLFHRLKTDMVEAKKLRAGLTFHGLRKSLGKRAADLGHGELAIAAALGHANPASSRPYTVEAERRRGAHKVFKSLERRR